MSKTNDVFRMAYGESDHEIWFNGFNYFIIDADHSRKSRAYDKMWYCKRAIDQNNIDWLEGSL